MKNRGVIIGQRSTDYIAGALPFENRNPSGDWKPYLPVGEKQYSRLEDSMACVTFSAINSLEIQTKLITGKEVNYSDRFIAKMSGTTKDGNYLYLVADTIRKCGLLNEEDWPAPRDFTWETYYTDIPDWLKTKALKWLNDWEVRYEFLADFSKEGLIYHLHHAPLQVVIPGHAVVHILNTKDVVEYFDTYEPYIKQYKGLFAQALKIVLYPKNVDRLVRANKDIYRLKNGVKDLFLNTHSFEKLDGRWGSVEQITQAELDAIRDGDVLIAVSQE
jgi:hypothetical protein